jgi:DNA-binding SARP family transcriptional activator
MPLEITKRQAALLATLAASPLGVPRDTLCHILWPQATGANGRNALKQLVFQTRRRLGVPPVIRSGMHVVLDPAHITVDAWQAIALMRSREWAKATEVAGGQFADGVEEPTDTALITWLAEVRERFDRLRADALRRAADSAEAAGLWGEAAEYWWRLSQLLPDDATVKSRRANANAHSLRQLG